MVLAISLDLEVGSVGLDVSVLACLVMLLDFIIKSKTVSHFKIPGQFIEMGEFLAEKSCETWTRRYKLFGRLNIIIIAI